jgi:hypothetical protein
MSMYLAGSGEHARLAHWIPAIAGLPAAASRAAWQ